MALSEFNKHKNTEVRETPANPPGALSLCFKAASCKNFEEPPSRTATVQRVALTLKGRQSRNEMTTESVASEQ